MLLRDHPRAHEGGLDVAVDEIIIHGAPTGARYVLRARSGRPPARGFDTGIESDIESGICGEASEMAPHPSEICRCPREPGCDPGPCAMRAPVFAVTHPRFQSGVAEPGHALCIAVKVQQGVALYDSTTSELIYY
jgi:hypothetical protein